jgi:hypothetical protein
MKYDEMVSGYRALYYRLLENHSIAERVKNKLLYLSNPVFKSIYSPRERFKIAIKFFTHGLMPGGFSRVFHFLRSIPFSKPSLIPLVVKEWIIALAMRDYVDRHFIQEFDKANDLTGNYLGLIEKAFQRYLHGGVLEVSLDQVKNAAANLSISMKGLLDRDFFNRAASHLEKVLQNTASSVTLYIEEFHEEELEYLNHLLKRLSRYGDRIYINVHERLRNIINIDSSVFNLVLESK